MPIVGNNYQLVSDRPDNGEPGDAAQIEAILQDISSALNEILSRIENFNVDFSNIDNRPTTLAGYGITDALPVGYVDAPMRAAVNNNASDLADILDNIDRSPAGLTEAMISSVNDYRSRTIIRAKSTNAEALVLEEKSARILGDTALASSLTSVSAKADDATAAGLFKIEAIAAPAGVDARLSLLARTDVAGTYRQAGLFIDVTGTVATVTVTADRFLIATGPNSAVPFAFVGSEFVFNGVLRSADNKRRIDPSGPSFISVTV